MTFGCKPKTKQDNQLKLKEIPLTCSPFEAFAKFYKNYNHTYLLESVEGPQKLAQYSFIGFNPSCVIRIKNGKATINNNEEKTQIKVQDPLNVIKEATSHLTLPYDALRFIGGAVGYISYDAIRYWEKLPKTATDDLGYPDIEMGIYQDGIIFDHRKKQVFYYYRNQDRLTEVNGLMKENDNSENLSYTQPKVGIKKEHFEKAVTKAKEYVASGHILQTVLSKRYEFSFKGDLIKFYKHLRRINPSPYMYYLKMDNRQIVGSSPEMLVRVDKKIVETFPIAGTRPRVEKQSENKKLAKELLADPKERAEHVMLVDLARNDIGRVSKYGTVQVPEFMTVHQYSHVQHIVSRVVGKLKKQCDSYDALRAIFPAGTVSGAPKVRAMEIIEESEPVRRGPYAGAVGYFSFNQNADFAITIRTLVANGNKAYIQVGAGIVADSVPEREWFETEHKAKALMKALEISGEENP